ncbi:MAG: M23 family metallopeptidase [bacterium]
MSWWRQPLTLIVIPHDGSDTHQLSVQWFTLFSIILVFGLLFGAGVFSAYLHYGSTALSADQSSASSQLASSSSNKEVRLKKLQNKLSSLKQELKKTRTRHQSILEISGFSQFQLPTKRKGGIQQASLKKNNTKQALNKTNKSIQNTLKRNQSLAKLREFMQSRNKVFRHTPMLWPVEGWMSSPYGMRKDPMGGKGKNFHEGIDIAAWHGSPVRAPADGKVTFSGWKSGYGQSLTIRHEYGYKTLFGHLSKRLVSKGQRVKKGTPIGRVGNTGHSTGSHVHYEVQVNGKHINPWPYLVEHYDSYKHYAKTKTKSKEESS